MSSRQVVFLIACLWGLVWTAPVVRAQLPSQASTQRSPRTPLTASGPATLDGYEPAPLRKEGFIQQLRALPQASVQVLQEAEDRQFRLPPRTNQARTNQVRQAQVNMPASEVASQNASPQRGNSLPVQPTGRTTLQPTHDSPWVERINQRDLTQSQAARALRSMPPTYSGLQNRPSARYQLIGEQAIVERSEEGHADEQFAAQELLDAEFDVGDEPRSETFEAITAASLQKAPRVSRVPLPRPAAMANGSPEPISQADEATDEDSITDAPARIAATPTSATPQLGSMRFSTAALKSESSDSHEKASPNSSFNLSLPELPLPASTLVGPQLPALPSISPSPVAAADAKPADAKPADLLSTNRQSLSDRAPATVEQPLHSSDQRLKMESPRIAVVLNGPSDLPVGTPAQYEVVVRNDDSIELQGLILRMDIPRGVKVNTLKPTHGQFELETAPDGLTMVTWGFERLAAGQTASAPMQLTAGSSQNFAVAMEWTLMPIAGTSSIDVRTPRLELALDGPAEVRFGQPNTYRLHIRNPGNAAANQIEVRLSAESFGSSAAQIEHIAPGEEEVIEVELTFNERGTINIAAVAEEQSGLASKTAIAVIVRQAIVQSQLLATPLVYHGTPTECRVRLTNSGDTDALDLRAVLQLPEGAGLVSAPPGAALNGGELTWRIDKLIAGSSEEYTVQLKLTADGANALALQCHGPGIVSTSAEAVTQVESITDLKLFVNDPLAPAPVGSEVVYELTLTNRGSKAATNVKVIAQFSDGIEPTRGEGHAARVVPGQTLFEPLPRLAAGETVNLKVFAKAAASGIHRFRVEVRSDETEVRLVQEESTQYLEPVSRIAAPMLGSSTLR